MFSLLLLFPLAHATDQWWNSSWKYRASLEIGSGDFPRENWPVERELNFSLMLADAGSANISLDGNSLRVFEYNSTGGLLWEVASQFDQAPGYSAENAAGTLVFEMNGTTNAGATRRYYAYFDSLAASSAPKAAPSYSSPLVYSWDGEEFSVNSSKMNWTFDTSRGDNTSGAYRAEGAMSLMFEAVASARTLEYSEYTNTSHNFGFNFSGNASFVSGPVRVAVTQTGDEVYWNDPTQPTGAARSVKKYYFYQNSPWYKVEQNITNTGASPINRSSTPAGALAFDALSAFGGSYQQVANASGIGSWAFAAPQFGGMGVGVIQVNQSGTTNFAAISDLGAGRVGIHLSAGIIGAGESVSGTAVLNFNDTAADYNLIEALRNAHTSPAAVSQGAAHEWNVSALSQTQFSIYNRNETVVVKANLTSDVYGLSVSANATIDMGTPGPGDDTALALYDDGSNGDAVAGDGVFTNNFTLGTAAALGSWNVSVQVFGGAMPLSWNYSLFNVTGTYVVSSSVLNAIVLTGGQVNLSVSVANFRNDTPVSGATIACNYTHSTLDYSNGSYFVNFSAPAVLGNYSVECSASAAGNNGTAISTFYAQAATTGLSVSASPADFNASNITQTGGLSFGITANASNTGNGTGYYANWSLALPPGWGANATSAQCGNVATGSYCAAGFTVNVPPATVPGSYYVNATVDWENPDSTASSNTAQVNITVGPNPGMLVNETSLSSYVAAGVQKTAGVFRLDSTGNDALQGVSFAASGFAGFAFAFSPSGIPSLAAGGTQAVLVNATADAGHATGIFAGTVNVTTSNAGYFELNLTLTVSGTNLSINSSPSSFNASSITQSQNQSFNATLNATNPGNATAFHANLSLALPSGWNASPASYDCGNLSVSQYCNATFLVTVKTGEAPGNFTANATVWWFDEELGASQNATAATWEVLSNPLLSIANASVSGSAEHNTTTTFTSIMINATGNDALSGMGYSITGFPAEIAVAPYPPNATIAAGAGLQIFLNATVPLAQPPGIYNGTMEISTSNAGSQNVSISLSVPENRSWTLNASYCERMESPDAGNACIVIINNTGNAAADFSISPSNANYSAPNATSFTLQNQSAYALLFTYNVSGVTKQPYAAGYLASAAGAGSWPNRTITISLVPFATIPVNASVSPAQVQQQAQAEITANVTDSNGVGILNATATVTAPNSTQYAYNMTFLNRTGSVYFYSLNFSAAILRGNYSVLVAGHDAIGVFGNTTANFSVYAKMAPNFQSLADKYYRGKTGSVYFRARDSTGNLLGGTNVTITINDSSSILFYNESFQTSAAGTVEPLPGFSIPSDAAVGNYTMLASAQYYDANASRMVNNTANYTFEVLPDVTVFSGLLADLQTSDLIIGADTIGMSISVYDANGTPMDAESLNLSIYAPDDSLYNSTEIANLTHHSAGLYSYSLPVSANDTPGMYMVVANLSRGNFTTRRIGLFRISQTLLSDIETAVSWYPQTVMEFDMMLYALDGKPLDADALNLSVYDPAGNFYFAVNGTAITRKSEGFYVYKYSMPVSTSVGYYVAYLNITRANYSTQKVKPFRVSAGGPYDVRLDLLDNEVQQGAYLDFNTTLINMGPLDQDVFLEYWTEDGAGKMWYYSSEAVFVGAGRNVSVLRSAFVYTAQAPGAYTLKAKLNYSAIQPVIEVNSSFRVVSRPAAVPPSRPQSSASGAQAAPASPGSAPTPSPTPQPLQWTMEIIDAPQEVTAQSGETKYLNIKVKNTGGNALHNLTISLFGILSGWIDAKPSRINSLAAGETGQFVIRLSVPQNAKEQQIPGRIVALADEKKEEREFSLRVFESKLALVEYELDKAERSYRQLVTDAKSLRDANKDTGEVEAVISQAYGFLQSGRGNLQKELIDDALLDTRLAQKMIDKGTGMLVSATYPTSVTGVQWNAWFFASSILFLVLAILAAMYALRRAKKGFRTNVFGQPIAVGAAAEKEAEAIAKQVAQQVGTGVQKAQTALAAARSESKSDLQAKREKLLRVLDLLEDERRKGILAESTYRQLRARNEKKLQQLEAELEM